LPPFTLQIAFSSASPATKKKQSSPYLEITDRILGVTCQTALIAAVFHDVFLINGVARSEQASG
jgi:hypothetical protein